MLRDLRQAIFHSIPRKSDSILRRFDIVMPFQYYAYASAAATIAGFIAEISFRYASRRLRRQADFSLIFFQASWIFARAAAC
jgi:hypothetical protein